mmetsp:Transcript_64591/g.75775  ORF Transcript_64591/g.75775 Transcript_64591/m.75775 type:complete len:83 (+) Transcript_64591:288-536(+)
MWRCTMSMRVFAYGISTGTGTRDVVYTGGEDETLVEWNVSDHPIPKATSPQRRRHTANTVPTNDGGGVAKRSRQKKRTANPY